MGPQYSDGGDILGDSNTFKLWQKCSLSSCNQNKIEFRLDGSSNDTSSQGWFIDKNSVMEILTGVMTAMNQVVIL